MKRTREDLEEKKIRRLWEEYQDIGWRARVGEVVTEEPKLVRTGDSDLAHYNYRLAQAVIETLGLEGQYLHAGVISIVRGKSLRSINREQKRRLPGDVADHFERRRVAGEEGDKVRVPIEDAKRAEQEPDWILGPALGRQAFFRRDGVARLSRWDLPERRQKGWKMRPGKKKPLFDPEKESRREEIKRRITEISGKPWWAAVDSVMEVSSRDRLSWRKSRRKLEEEAQEEKAREAVLEACIRVGGPLNEVRHGKRGQTHSYAEAGPSNYDRYGFWTGSGENPEDQEPAIEPGDSLEVMKEEADLIKKYRRDSSPTLEERLNGSAEKLRNL